MTTGWCNNTKLLGQEVHPVGSSHPQPMRCSSCCTGNHGIDCTKPQDYHKICMEGSIVSLRTSRGQEQQRRRRKMKRIFKYTCLCIFNILASTAICLLLLKYVRFPDSSEPRTESTRICIPCGSSGEPAVGGRHGKVSDENLVCCTKDDTQIRELVLEGVKLSLQDRLKGDELYNLLNNPLVSRPINRNAAHVYLRLNKHHSTGSKRRKGEGQDEDHYDVIRSWSSDGNSAFIRQGIEYNASQGHFNVKEAGIYVVYCRLVYEKPYDHDSKDAGDEVEPTMVLGHTISSFVPLQNDYRNLLEDEQLTQCSSDDAPCYNSQIFSTLHLTRDMSVAVRVRHSRFLSQKFQASYFGIYKID